MGNVIALGEKWQSVKARKAAAIKKQKRMAIQKVFQCSHCAFKCEKCGTQMDMASGQAERHAASPTIPYHFCESCAEEYIDYINRLKGKGDPDCYWHNETWLRVWDTWIDYQGAIDSYLKSKEFMQVMHELNQSNPDR